MTPKETTTRTPASAPRNTPPPPKSFVLMFVDVAMLSVLVDVAMYLVRAALPSSTAQ